MGYGGSFAFACIIWFSVPDTATGLWAGFVGLLLFFGIGMVHVCYLIKKGLSQGGFWSWRLAFNDLMFRNMVDLRDDLAVVVGHIPLIWAVLIKFVIPPLLLVLFSLGFVAKTPSGKTEFGHYGGFPTLPYQLLGVLTIVFVGVLFISAVTMPRLYEGFQKTNSPVPSKDSTNLVTQIRNPDESGDVVIDSHGVWPPKTVDLVM